MPGPARRVLAVPAIPRTLTGKKLEIPIKRILTGVAADQAVSRDALADPTAHSIIAMAAERRRAAEQVPTRPSTKRGS